MIDYSVFNTHHAGPGKVDFARVPCGNDAWSGAICREDRRLAVDTIRCLIENGHYPTMTMGMNREQKVGAAMRHFAIEGTFFGAEPYGNGHINDTYRVVFADAGKLMPFLVQRINHNVFRNPPALMENIGRVTSHLATQFSNEPDALTGLK